MLEFEKHSKNYVLLFHINKAKINKVFVSGKNIVSIFKNLSKSKKGGIHNNYQIIESD